MIEAAPDLSLAELAAASRVDARTIRSWVAEAGGGRLHDAAEASEIDEVVLGELREGRATLVERATLRLAVTMRILDVS